MKGPFPDRVEWRKECDTCEGEGVIMRTDMPLHHQHSEAPEYATDNCGECGGDGWRWTDEPVTLAECRPGPFLFNGFLGFKTEYGMAQTVGPVNIPGDQVRWTISNLPDAYVMESGECFWGGVSTHDERSKLLVWPVEGLAIASVDRNPEGEKPQALSAEHESAVPKADAQIHNDYNAQSPLPAPPDNQ